MEEKNKTDSFQNYRSPLMGLTWTSVENPKKTKNCKM